MTIFSSYIKNRLSLEIDSEELTINCEKTNNIVRVKLSSLRSLWVYKQDLLTVDLICWRFDLHELPSVEIDEEMVNYERVITTLEKTLSINPNWRDEVAKPAFQTNLTRVWSSEP